MGLKNVLSPAHIQTLVSPMFNLPVHHLSYNLPDIGNEFYTMSTQLQSMTTEVKNANQHPGYIQMKWHKLSVPADKPKVKKAAAKAMKLAKATAKEVSTMCALKYERNAMEREDMLNATPHPNFNSTTSHHNTVPASDSSAPGMVSESDMDDEMNPDKGTYKSGSTTEDNLANDSPVISSHKRTYAEVASPRKTAPNAAKWRAAPLPDNSEMKPNSVPSRSLLPGFADHNSPATLTLLDPKPPMPKKKGGQQKAHLQVISKTTTEPDSPPPLRQTHAPFNNFKVIWTWRILMHC